MLTQVTAQNYKCLENVTVDLGPFNVLIGPNDTGKSSFLEVLRWLRDVAARRFKDVGHPSIDNVIWRMDTTRSVFIRCRGKTDNSERAEAFEYEYFLRLPGSKARTGGTPAKLGEEFTLRLSDGREEKIKIGGFDGVNALLRQFPEKGPLVVRDMSSTDEYRFDPRVIRMPSVPKADEGLRSDGANLAAVLDAMQNATDNSPFQSVAAALRGEVPTIARIVLPSVRDGGAKILAFVLSGGNGAPVTIPAVHASEGALLLTAFLVLAYGPTPPAVLLLEEPENGLHPSRLKLVVDTLRKISTGEIGTHPRQVVLTTHSPLLLNYVKPEEVRIFTRPNNDGTVVTPMSKVPDVDRLLKEFSTGELWNLLGEEHLLKGTMP
jgi:predicted ATPase